MNLLQQVSGDLNILWFTCLCPCFRWVDFQGDVDDNVSVTSGSMSLDLGDMWKHGCPKSPDWDGDIDVWPVGQGIQ